MTKKITLRIVFLLATIMTSCNSDDEAIVEKEPVENLTFKTNSSIVNHDSDCKDCSPYSLYIEDGENIVFMYSKRFPNNSGNIEGGSTEILRFEVVNDTNEFSYSNNDLVNIKAHYDEISFINIPTTNILKGTISGSKLDDNSWSIKIDVEIDVKTLDKPLIKKIEGVFK